MYLACLIWPIMEVYPTALKKSQMAEKPGCHPGAFPALFWQNQPNEHRSEVRGESWERDRLTGYWNFSQHALLLHLHAF